MGGQAPRARQRYEAARPARDSVGLCGRPFDSELGEPAARSRRDTAPSAPADTEKCRSLLAALLRRAWPGEAGAWADTLIAEFGSLPAALAVGAGDRARSIGPEPARF